MAHVPVNVHASVTTQHIVRLQLLNHVCQKSSGFSIRDEVFECKSAGYLPVSLVRSQPPHWLERNRLLCAVSTSPVNSYSVRTFDPIRTDVKRIASILDCHPPFAKGCRAILVIVAVVVQLTRVAGKKATRRILKVKSCGSPEFFARAQSCFLPSPPSNRGPNEPEFIPRHKAGSPVHQRIIRSF